MKTEVGGPKSEMQDKASDLSLYTPDRGHSDFPTSDIRLSDIRHQISNNT